MQGVFYLVDGTAPCRHIYRQSSWTLLALSINFVFDKDPYQTSDIYFCM